MILYERPLGWIQYDAGQLLAQLSRAKSAVLSLATMPYQKRWVDALQKLELKREVAGTSRIEGAEFTERELDAALKEAPDDLFTRSQRQARAALRAYEWIATLPPDQPVDAELILHIHRLIVTDADDDHCEPGRLRTADQNVVFGQPRHRGIPGGAECQEAFESFTTAIQEEYRSHDPLIQAIAAHYHLAAMHPFLDGNGRTARALEALLLRRAGLRQTTFIAMSNYYYDEKAAYLTALADVRQARGDLTAFLAFSLRGVELQARRLLAEIQHHIKKELYRGLMVDLFGRLRTTRKRVIADRQMKILRILLEGERVDFNDLYARISPKYGKLKTPVKALARDISYLRSLGAISVEKVSENQLVFSPRLDWPERMTETAFFEAVNKMPKAKTGSIF